MGGTSSNPIRNIDKRTARREYRAQFCRAIAEYRYAFEQQTAAADSPLILNFSDSSSVRVCVRKRPIHKHETDLFEFDCITVGRDAKQIKVHDARMHADMRRMLMNHHTFRFDGAFDEFTNNDTVYKNVGLPLVLEACAGGFATCMVYGQTGSGKTFTMSSFYDQASRDVFATLAEKTERFEPVPTISLSFFELHGDVCLDLLNGFNQVQLLTAADGSVQPFPIVEPTVQSADELIALISHAISIRTTAATGVHDSSSRSHAVLRIYINTPGTPGQDTREGVLTLVDLAGSEQSIDSMHHTADRRKEGALINSSLLALKECVKARAEGQNDSFHYRKSKLTMALKHSFVLPSAKTVILATVSPASKDTEHSLNTLRHACLMNGDQQGSGEETRFLTGGTTESVVIGEVDVSALGRQAIAAKKAGKVIKDKSSNGNVMGAGAGPTFGGATGKEDVEQTEKQKAKARRIADHRSLKALHPQHRALLEHHRQRLGGEEQQIRRQRRPPLVVVNASEGAQEVASDSADDDVMNVKVSSSSSSLSTAPPAPQASAAEKRRTLVKLYKSVYGEEGGPDVASGDLQRRQLVTLMKMHGYSAAEIESLAPPLRPEVQQHLQQQAAQWKAEKEVKPVRTFVLNMGVDRPSQQTQPAPTLQVRQTATTTTRESRPSSSSSSSSSSSTSALTTSNSTALLPTSRGPAAKENKQSLANAAKAVLDDASLREKRREDARLIRDRREQAQRDAILAKIDKKRAQTQAQMENAAAALAAAEQAAANEVNSNSPPPAVPSPRSPSANPQGNVMNSPPAPQDRPSIIRRLEADLETARIQSLSQATRYGLQRQLAVEKAALIRDERQKELRETAEESNAAEEAQRGHAALASLKNRIKQRGTVAALPSPRSNWE